MILSSKKQEKKKHGRKQYWWAGYSCRNETKLTSYDQWCQVKSFPENFPMWKKICPTYVNTVCLSIVVKAVLLKINHAGWTKYGILSKDNAQGLYMMCLSSFAYYGFTFANIKESLIQYFPENTISLHMTLPFTKRHIHTTLHTNSLTYLHMFHSAYVSSPASSN